MLAIMAFSSGVECAKARASQPTHPIIADAKWDPRRNSLQAPQYSLQSRLYLDCANQSTAVASIDTLDFECAENTL